MPSSVQKAYKSLESVEISARRGKKRELHNVHKLSIIVWILNIKVGGEKKKAKSH